MMHTPRYVWAKRSINTFINHVIHRLVNFRVHPTITGVQFGDTVYMVNLIQLLRNKIWRCPVVGDFQKYEIHVWILDSFKEYPLYIHAFFSCRKRC